MNASFYKRLPEELKENVIGVCGQAGREWLRDLPNLISQIESQWNVEVGQHFSNLSYNFVAPATRSDGRKVVIKLGLPSEDKDIHGEASYLRCLNGNGVVRLLHEDKDLRALLLESAHPGSNLREVCASDPESAALIAAKLLNELKRSPPTNLEFVALRSWVKKLEDAEKYDFPAQCANKALEIFNSSSDHDQLLLHGDFHHLNILAHASNSFVAIDPKGIIGDLKYDIAVFLNNHRSWLRSFPDIHSSLDKSLAMFADKFGFSDEDLKRWAFAQKILSAFWTMTENGDGWQRQLASADIWNV
jgi:streptomycin 6-kinase